MLFLMFYSVQLLYHAHAYHYVPAKNGVVCTSSFGYKLCIGVLDTNGIFIPEIGELERVVRELNHRDDSVRLSDHWPNVLGSSLKLHAYENCYEYRYAMLIPMRVEVDKLGNAKRIPAVNERIKSIHQYLYGMEQRWIINLPGAFEAKKRKVTQIESHTEYHDTHHSLGQGNGSNREVSMSDEYVFKPDYSKLECTMSFCNQKCIGKVDQFGIFTPYPEELERIAKERRGAAPDPKKVFPNQLLVAQYKNEAVYEYRYGALIPEVFDEQNRPIPELGGTIIDFKDYVYSPPARRIYNLPGSFVLKKDK